MSHRILFDSRRFGYRLSYEEKSLFECEDTQSEGNSYECQPTRPYLELLP